ncbi:type II toxin-antitoxin system HicB family antitoxin [Bacteroides caecigallinarum]|uniref:type II toxin-antitoxin system HicB family antitoxin n=1 Tax=Bacteroides caecigallinarum TaxID=1411144 RepID=UPI001F256A30|nr:type II toxin-antitoxin system HicB family antitoxin [Bacteroides caecigallinarum]MCF2594507.1 type II toxin-antitoxin system HicB family antitoxin [Bacteroides caecigallinarum]
MNEVNYVIESLPNGEFCAYLLDYNQCCAYGETENEAIENLQEISYDFFNEISSVFSLEDMA